MGKRGNGEGTIYYSEKLNKWVGQFTAGRKADGKINRKSVYGNTRKEVKEKITKALVDVQTNTYIEKQNITISELGTELLETKLKINKIKENAYNASSYALLKIKENHLGDLPIQKVTYLDIQNFLNTTTNLSNSYIEKIIIQLNLIFKEAQKREYIYKNPMLNIIRPISDRVDKKVEALSLEEQRRFLEIVKGNRYEDLFKIQMFSGMRCGEILALTPDDVDLENNIIHISKTISKDKKGRPIINSTTKTNESTRDIPITSIFRHNIVNAINNAIDNKYDLIFSTKNGNINSVVNVNCYLRRLCNKYQLKDSNISTHILRHTYATRCIESGMPAEVLQKLLGHKNISTTINTYTTIFDKFRDDVVSECTQNIALKLNL